MAVVNKAQPSAAGRRLLVGTNVAAGIVLVAGIIVVVQAIAFQAAPRWDMTSSRVNSLSEGTENLLRGLDSNIRLTSLYFESDLDEEDQQRYRTAAKNLIDLYESSHRTKISTEWINPLKDTEKLQALKARLLEKTKFKKEIEPYRARIEAYQNDIDRQMNQLVKTEIDTLAALGGGIGGSTGPQVGQVENLFLDLTGQLEQARNQIDRLADGANPQFAPAVNELRTLYRKFGKLLKDIAGYGTAEAAKDPRLPADQADFLRQAGSRYASVVAAIEAESTELQELESLKADEVIGELGATTNAILVETDEEARVVDFPSVWPPLNDQARGRRAKFKDRAFKGEEKLTAAILRVTHKEQTAAIFVRYGGMPLFMGGFMPGAPPAAFAAMKQQLEDANFIVEEWDLKTSDTPPEIDPAPTKRIYVVLIPTPPKKGQFGQPSQELPFTDAHRRRVVEALGENPRALFLAGWMPGPFGVIPASYGYNDYLKETWGVHLDTSALLIQTTSLKPGQYIVTRRDFYNMNDLEIAEHDIVYGLRTARLAFPWCAPLVRAETQPEGVEITPLLVQPERDGLWGIHNIKAYEDQLAERQYMTKVAGDLVGPFELAVAATKGEGKIVLVSARDFALDNVAFAREMAITAQGFTLRARNPGNVTLVVNALHWLNDNTAFMNIGRPIDASVLAVDSGDVKFLRILAIVVIPLLPFGCGIVAWRIRRR
ncbi:MAG: Gldg family protein [Planctomycetes bacterium]|nr:Gldg family protein [Planctomycetota bacterium]